MTEIAFFFFFLKKTTGLSLRNDNWMSAEQGLLSGCWPKRLWPAGCLWPLKKQRKKRPEEQNRVAQEAWYTPERRRRAVALLRDRPVGLRWLCQTDLRNSSWPPLSPGRPPWRFRLKRLMLLACAAQEGDTGFPRVTGDHQPRGGTTELCASPLSLCLWFPPEGGKIQQMERPWGHPG